MFKKLFFVALATFALAQGAKAQTNLQVFYDFGKDRGIITSTLEGFYGDKWGNTFFFIDHDFVPGETSINGTYLEIARCFNFWQDSALGGLSIHAEYNGGVYSRYGIDHAALFGLDYFFHSKDYKNTLNLKVLYKWIDYTAQPLGFKSNVPMQLTAVWGLQDLFGLKGLRFSGFADFWWQDHLLFYDAQGFDMLPETSHVVFISEPQLWYNVGQHFGVPNLNVGGEVELSYDFGSSKGFWVRPCLGVKWVF